MTWTVWDVLVIILGIVQLALLGAVAYIILGVVRGPIAGVTSRAGDVVARGRSLANAAGSAVTANRAHILAIVADLRGISDTLRAPDATRSLPINYHTLRRVLTAVMTVRRGMGTVRSIRASVSGMRTAGVRGWRKTSPPPRRARRSFAEHIGLVPPIVARLTPLLPYARAAFGAWKQMRGRAVRHD
jgi:hypothetical protein